MQVHNFHPKTAQGEGGFSDEIAAEVNEMVESEENFFLIQQIQERTQLLDEKRKHFKDNKTVLTNELSKLEAREQELDDQLQKAQFEVKLLGRTGINENFNDSDLNEVRHFSIYLFR